MVKTNYYKRTSDGNARTLFLTESDNAVLAEVDKIASNVKVSYYNDNGTILLVEVDVESDKDLKIVNKLLWDNGFSTDLETMLRKS